MSNFAPILIKAKFQKCSLMKMNIFGANSFLGESAVVFFVVIWNFYHSSRNNGKSMLCEIRYTI